MDNNTTRRAKVIIERIDGTRKVICNVSRETADDIAEAAIGKPHNAAVRVYPIRVA